VNLQLLWLHIQLRLHRDDEKGASLVEYALLVALIAVVCIAAIALIGNSASSKLSTTGASIQGGGS
jgi:pilus assembly protein Flp/PilA